MKKYTVLAVFAAILSIAAAHIFGKAPADDPNRFSDEVIKMETKDEAVKPANTAAPVPTVKPKPTRSPAPAATPVKKKTKAVSNKKKKTAVKNEKSPEQREIDALIDKIKKKQSGRRAMTTNIVIKTSYTDAGTSQKIKGDVIIKEKDKFRVHYTEPTEQFLISDGKTLWVYTPALNQVIKQDADAAQLNTNFYIEIESSLEYFVKNSKTVLKEEGNNHVFTMIPKNKKILDFDEIIVKVDKTTLIPGYMAMKFEGTLMEVEFSDVKNYDDKQAAEIKELNDENFEFKAPDGVDEIEASTFFE